MQLGALWKSEIASYVGMAIVLLGLLHVVIWAWPGSWGRYYRESWRWGRGAKSIRVSRIGGILCSLAFVVFGVFMALDGRFPQLHQQYMPCVIATSFGLMLLAGGFDSFRRWSRRGFPVWERCPWCHTTLDFRLVASRCPECARDLPEQPTKK